MDPLRTDIYKAAVAKVKKFEARHSRATDENRRRERRSLVLPVKLEVSRPKLWSIEPAFDPYHVRSRADSIAHSIDAKIRVGSYAPIVPHGHAITKPSGGERTITVFALADEVVSSRTYRHLMAKNRARLSARSYAYRDDLNVHDAIAHLQAEWADLSRLYVANFDFSDYFGSISHEHIWRTVDSLQLALTRTERAVFRSFLEAPLPTNSSSRGALPVHRQRGVPQGTSLSLLAANIAATPLDRRLERLGVSFARYADDILIWSSDYASIAKAVDELFRFSTEAECPINHTKSLGIQLLVPDTSHKTEIAKTTSVEFLSHGIGLTSTQISERALRSIKSRCEDFIYDNLLREPLAGTQNLNRISGGLDRDYVTLIWQVRRYLYGNKSEEQIRRLLKGPIPSSIRLGGAMARFPYVTDTQQLQDFDRWLSARVWLALQKRARLLSQLATSPPALWKEPRQSLANAYARSPSTGNRVDIRLPSARRMAEVVWRSTRAHGRGAVTYSERNY